MSLLLQSSAFSLQPEVMLCPKCRNEMEKVTHEGIEVDRCTYCGGLWFDFLEHKTLSMMPWSDMIDLGKPEVGRIFDKVAKITCPVCESAMERTTDPNNPRLAYESCPGCRGVFFDAGEFRKYVKGSRLDML